MNERADVHLSELLGKFEYFHRQHVVSSALVVNVDQEVRHRLIQ